MTLGISHGPVSTSITNAIKVKLNNLSFRSRLVAFVLISP
jgi:hypothetical protein